LGLLAPTDSKPVVHHVVEDRAELEAESDRELVGEVGRAIEAPEEDVRREARDAGTGSRPLSVRQVGRVLDGVGADLGALIEVTHVELTADNVRSDARQSRDRNGEQVAWRLERGRYVVRVSAEVLHVDADGTDIEQFTLSGRGSGNFERGAYRGDVEELQLSRNELRYFDPDVLEEQRAQARRGALEELAENLAERVFAGVTRLVR